MKKFSIIGKPIGHSLSPMLHNYWFKKYNIDANYSLMGIEEDEIKNIIEKIRSKEIQGINVTIPYKEKVVQYLDRLVNDAKTTRSVNTVFMNDDGEIIGDNSDVYGIQAAYLKKIENEKINNALIIGAGGISPSIITALKKLNLKNISVINRTYDRAIFLKKRFEEITVIKWEELKSAIKDFDIIINATSLGLKNGKNFDFLFENCKKKLIYIDIVYNPMKTEMIQHLESNNIKTFNGLDMFVYQGQKSFYLWNKINPEIDDNLINLLKSKLND